MGYIENNLVKGEEIVFTTKLHWWAIVGAALNAFILVVLLGACLASSNTLGSTAGGKY